MDIERGLFVWDQAKEEDNIRKHGIDFTTAAYVFCDPERRIVKDEQHSHSELRYYCVGRVGDLVITVRFTYRGQRIRIIGAGSWRKGRRLYETPKIG